MNPEYVSIATESREEIVFWPLVTAIYLYTESGFEIYLLVIVLASAFGAQAYKLLKNLREEVSNTVAEKSLRSRSDVSNEEILDVVESVSATSNISWDYLTFGVNGLIGIVLYPILILSLISSNNPTLIGAGLFAVPVVTVGVAIWGLLR
ncbi:hypothetical protein [Halobellus sp. Atlit-38R]|uniref:hypothetical protein n=1 Tax=Halobellus sp. Atlit-38R TaxID=2282131 RepID=UPI0011C39CEB|nr:hypothetical protein [Halobellus sp. Atlit-38R]